MQVTAADPVMLKTMNAKYSLSCGHGASKQQQARKEKSALSGVITGASSSDSPETTASQSCASRYSHPSNAKAHTQYAVVSKTDSRRAMNGVVKDSKGVQKQMELKQFTC